MKKIVTTIVVILIVLVTAFAGYVYMINRPLPQNEHDVAILDRTMEILGDEDHWARTGDRSCETPGPPLNLYCALRQASIDVTGEFKHRSAALQQVRYAIERQNPGVDYAHRLMDYNNDPSTSYRDLREVLLDAHQQLVANWKSGKG